MADSFQGSGKIILQPGDTNIPFNFNFKVATSSNVNDGAIPYGSTLTSVTATAHRVDGVAVDAGNLIQAATDFIYSSNMVMIPLTYSTQLQTTELGGGLYHIEIKADISRLGQTSDNFIRQFDFDRVEVKTS